jgi:hypothetical protein
LYTSIEEWLILQKIARLQKKESEVLFSVYEEPWNKGREREGRHAWTGHTHYLQATTDLSHRGTTSDLQKT